MTGESPTSRVLTFASEVSLIIPAHRAGPMLEACLQGVALLDPPPLEVIVAIDGHSPPVEALARSLNFRVLALPNAPGVSATRNAGARLARGKFLIFLDSDVLPPPEFLDRANAALTSIPGAVAAFGSYDASPSASGLVSRYRNLLHHFTHQHGRRNAQSFWAACGICEAEIFWQAGGFDESYRQPCIEDIALGYKIRRAGHRIALDPSWQVKHLKKWTWRDLIFTDIGRRAIPWTLLLLREDRLDNDLNIDKRCRWSALMVIACLASLTGALFLPWLVFIAASSLTAAIFLNRRFYQFLARTAGLPFALGAIPLHLFYYLAASVGWISGKLLFVFQRISEK